jgi:hypothetical protein
MTDTKYVSITSTMRNPRITGLGNGSHPTARAGLVLGILTRRGLHTAAQETARCGSGLSTSLLSYVCAEGILPSGRVA